MSDISVQFKVVTKDKLRQITIDLSKVTQDSGKAEWSMDFTLGEKEKKSDPKFEEVISLKVKIKPTNAPKAQATAKDGLNDKQTSQTFIAGDAAKLLTENQISEKTVKTQAEKIIAVR